jgi:biopolymer transport protein ExbD
MGPEDRSDSSGGGVVIAVMLVLFLLVVGGVAALAAIFVARSSAQSRAVMAMQREALAQEAAARAMAERAAASAATLRQSPAASQTIAIQIDEAGAMQVDGEPTPLADLKTRLDALRSVADSQVEVLIQVHERCPAASVLEVVQVSNELGLDDVRLAPLAEPVKTE